jgi:IclR family transcriptional regulator, acetate operon repressor
MKSVRTAFAVLEAVSDHQPAGVSELARHLDLPKSTVQRALQTLAEIHWVRATGDERATRWVLTTRALTIGSAVARDAGFRAIAMPVMQQLGSETGETIHLTVPEDGDVVLIDKVSSTHPVPTVSWVGGRAPIHATASGLAMLSRMPAHEVDHLLAPPLDRWTELTQTDPAELRAELERVRDRGWAMNPGWWRVDVAAIGATVVDRAGRVVGAISISTPAHRLSVERHAPYGRLVCEAADRIGREL